jgi:hypothetical protein
LANIEPSPALLEVVETQQADKGESASSSEDHPSSLKFSDLISRLRK